MKHVSVLIKPASSLCNMRCSYCFYRDVSVMRETASYGLMTVETMRLIIDQVFMDLEDGDHLELAFQGGEPTLAGLPYFEALTAYVASQPKDIRLGYSIQTNGLLLDDQWAEFLRKNGFLVGLSMDGTSSMHDVNRLDASGQGTHGRVLKARHLLEAYQVPVNILTVLTRSLAREPDNMMDYLVREQIEHVQFIPCLPALEDEEKNPEALTPELFASFYDRVAVRWLAELRKGRSLHIQLFDAVIELLATGNETVCGLKGKCHIQNIIEADGSVYPCDFYVLDGYRMGNLTTTRIFLLRGAPAAQTFLREGHDMAGLCMTCPYARICRGGCKRMRDTAYLDRTGDFCGYQAFLDRHYKAFRFIAQQFV